MMTVRHPLARIYSAWRDKFRNNHPWMGYIRPRYGQYLDLLERKNMTNDSHEYSFEAFAELLALTPFDSQRDRHWQSMDFYCSPCQFKYDFIVKQEESAVDYPSVLNISGYQQKYPKLHIPDPFAGSLDVSKISKPYRNISRGVIENLYRNYFS